MADEPFTMRDQTEALVEAVAQAWYDADPGWNTAPARRELARAALAALPTFVTKLDDGRWVDAVGRYAFDKTMETLSRVEKERMQAVIDRAHAASQAVVEGNEPASTSRPDRRGATDG